MTDCATLDRAAVRARSADAVERDGFCVVTADAWREINRHATSRTDAEVGGVLLGEVCADGEATYLLIDGHVPALAATSSSASVTFTADAWTKIHATIDRDRPGATIVGWYHTHPSFGIFLSEMDLFIHRNFFDAAYQVAIVIDPVRREHGAFVWRAGEPTREAIRIERGPPIVETPPGAAKKLLVGAGVAVAIVALALFLDAMGR